MAVPAPGAGKEGPSRNEQMCPQPYKGINRTEAKDWVIVFCHGTSEIVSRGDKEAGTRGSVQDGRLWAVIHRP